MNDATQPVVAQGSLEKTPFAHLVLYLYQRRASGTLLVDTAGHEAKVLFHRGRAVAAHLARAAAALDEGLLPLCALTQGGFEFHDSDLVGSGPSILTGMFDPFAFAAEAARRYARPEVIQEVLAKYATVPLSLQPAMDPSRLLLTVAEARFTQLAAHEPLTIDELCVRGQLQQSAAQRLLYVLLITKVLGPAVEDSSTSSVRAGVEGSDGAGQTPNAPNASRSSTTRAPVARSADRSRSSGAAWRAIAMRASEMSSNRPSPAPSDSRPSASSSSSSSTAALRPPSRPLTPAPQTLSHAPPRAIPQRPVSRPLTLPPSALTPTPASTQPPARAPSRPLTPAAFGSIPPRATPSSPISSVTPRPSSTPLELLDSPGKFRRVDQLCQRHAYEEALPIIRALVEEDRKSAKYLGMLAQVLLGRCTDNTIGKEIVETVNLALRMDPDEVRALYTKARCYKRMGKEREALHYFRRTIVVDPQHLDATREVRLLLLRMTDKRKR
jgi:tetratricopeptide (TPR) repeat protein